MERILRGIDLPLLLMYLFIVLFGITNIYSVSEDFGIKQLTWFFISTCVGLLIFAIRVQFFENFAGVFYVIGLMLLVLLFPLGKEINGAKAWFVFGPVSLQPVEFVKIATALMLGNFINSPTYSFQNLDSKIKIFATVLIPILLILAQPDVGSILVFTAFFIALFREGLNGIIFIVGGYFLILFLSSLKSIDNAIVYLTIISIFLLIFYLNSFFINKFIYTIFIITSSLLVVYVFFYNELNTNLKYALFVIFFILLLLTIFFRERNKKLIFLIIFLVSLASIPLMILSPIIFSKLPKHQKERIDVLFEGEAKYRDTAGYNLLYSKTSIGSGGLFGKGFNNGTVTDGGFVPEQHTDYIFSVVGEEWGFLGSSILLIVYACFIMRIYYLSDQQKSSFHRVFGYCIASIFFMHFIINVGMVIGLFPTVGIPLPYFSYGGSSLLAFSVMFYIFLRLNFFDNRSLV